MEEESFEKLYNESLNEKKFDKRITGTVIQISRKGEIFVDFKYKADGIIPRKEYSDDENKNPKDEFKPGDTITADVIKWNDGLGNVLLSYKKYRREEDKKIERELKIKQAEEIKRQKIERAKNIEEFWNNIKIGKAYKGTVSKIVDYGIFVDLGVVTGLAHKSELVWDKNEKIEVKLDELSSKIGEILELIQQNMFDTCKKRMEAKTTIAHNLEEFQANMNKEQGFIKAMWCGNEECEAKIKELTAAKSRCMPFEQEHIGDTCVCCGKPATKMVYWGRQY